MTIKKAATVTPKIKSSPDQQATFYVFGVSTSGIYQIEGSLL